MNASFLSDLRSPCCASPLELHSSGGDSAPVDEATLSCPCGRRYPLIAGVPRLLPRGLMSALEADHPDFFARHPELRLGGSPGDPERSHSAATQRAFGDEWVRFPEILEAHARIFSWYFESPEPVRWEGLRVLDAGCGMGRWLHFARQAGARVVAMDVSKAIDVVASREAVDCVQADLRHPPFAPQSFDLVYTLGVLHHLEDPVAGLMSLARLVKPGGELRLYVYRSLEDEAWPRRALLGLVTQLRRLTTRLPYSAVHLVALALALVGTLLVLVPRRLLRLLPRAGRLTEGWPLAQYTDVPFRMLVAEQFDRLVAPLERRYRRQDVEAWFRAVGFETVCILPGLGWRGVARRPR